MITVEQIVGIQCINSMDEFLVVKNERMSIDRQKCDRVTTDCEAISLTKPMYDLKSPLTQNNRFFVIRLLAYT